MEKITHRFSSPLSRDLFGMGVSMQSALAEIYREVPKEQTELSPEDVNRMAAIEDEKRSEGRTMRPFRTNPHGE